MQEEEKKMLREIHEFLLGDFQKQGFIGETKSRLDDLEKVNAGFKKALGFVAVPLGLVIVERISNLLL